jgi:hypothetical protein
MGHVILTQFINRPNMYSMINLLKQTKEEDKYDGMKCE